jgi:hypothetical protein
MKILRISSWFSQIAAIIGLMIIYYFSVPLFQPQVNYPKYVHKTIYLDRYLAKDEVEFITYAALKWGESTKYRATFDIVTLPQKNVTITENDIIILNTSPDNPHIMMLDENNKFFTYGYYDPNSPIPAIYLVSDRLTDENYVVVVMHELGHALGLKHNDDINGIGTLMYPNIILAASKITSYDLMKFCKLYHCNVKDLQN